MFCCIPDTLYVSIVALDPYNVYLQVDSQSLSQKLKDKSSKFLLPPVMELATHSQFQDSQNSQFQEGLPQYQLSFSDEARQFQIQELMKSPAQKIWKVLLKNQEEQLTEGEMFSFDSYEFQVYRLQTKSTEILSVLQVQTDDKCRICLSEITSQKNPLLNLCNCIGTIKYMHLQCCRQWLREGLDIQRNENYASFLLTKTQCNICKQKWKKKVKYLKRQYFLFDFQMQSGNLRPSQMIIGKEYSPQNETAHSNHISLLINNFDISEEGQQQKCGLYMLRIPLPQPVQKSQKCFKIGKDQTCDIVLNQLFIQSPFQCEIRTQGHKLYVKDSDSVNGTNVEIKNIKNANLSTKYGILLKFDTSVMKIQGRNNLFSCFDPQILYKIKYKPYKQQRIT